MNTSPLYGFSKAFADFKLHIDDYDIHNSIKFKFVKMLNVKAGEEDSEDNKEGLRLLHQVGMELCPLEDKDWLFLRQTLRDPVGMNEQQTIRRHVTTELQRILSE